MTREAFCIACEGRLPHGRGMGVVCLDCYRKLKRPSPKPVRVRRSTASVTSIFPLPCSHSEDCPCWKRPKFGVIYINRRRQAMYVGGPFSYRQAEIEARHVRAGKFRA